MKRIAVMCVMTVVVVACGQRAGTGQPGPAGAPAGEIVASVPTPRTAAAHGTAPSSIMTPAPAAPAPTRVSGTVLEAQDAAGYTYLRLKTGNSETWVAIPRAKVEVGAGVTVSVSMVAEGFESKSLNRTFDRLVMGTLEGGETAAAPAPTRPSGDPHAGIPMPPSAGVDGDETPIRVARAEGAEGRTVAEVWGSRAALKDGTVAVRGRVVKFLPGIMGKNWLHLRDGSGSKAAGDHDITVTTADTAAVGEVVLVRGTLRVDKDFGAGYSYAVIVEDASVSR